MAEFDFTGVSKTTGGSVTLIDEGAYTCRISKIQKRVKENGNIVLDIDGEIQDGPFQGERLRYFQTVVGTRPGMTDAEMGKLKKNWGIFLNNLEILGILDEAQDRAADGTLSLSFTYETIGGETEIVGAVVNGGSRKVLGNRYTANVTHVEKLVDTAEGPKTYINHQVKSLESAGATPEPLGAKLSLNPTTITAAPAPKLKPTKKIPQAEVPAAAPPADVKTAAKKLPW